ncbi:acyltransferase [Fusarium langsethiae]|uniref:Acyltransferase n=1 Tax=Fusarium langsethiae TaxID=179993 RepID=A0A0M9ERE7_FUSLA|nr:acyltransferase [Fusarium langsethiae]
MDVASQKGRYGDVQSGKGTLALLSWNLTTSCLRWKFFIAKICSFLYSFLIPSFLAGPRSLEPTRAAGLSPTAHLDGLRGICSAIVVIYHHCYQCYNTSVSWGAEKQYYDLMRLPIIRLLYNGPPAVAIFFVISGYALSYRVLHLSRSRNTNDAFIALSSLVFRRVFRLFIPITVSTFFVFLLLRAHAFEATRELTEDKTLFRDHTETHAVRLPGAWEQWKDWSWHAFKEVHIFAWDTKETANRKHTVPFLLCIY